MAAVVKILATLALLCPAALAAPSADSCVEEHDETSLVQLKQHVKAGTARSPEGWNHAHDGDQDPRRILDTHAATSAEGKAFQANMNKVAEPIVREAQEKAGFENAQEEQRRNARGELDDLMAQEHQKLDNALDADHEAVEAAVKERNQIAHAASDFEDKAKHDFERAQAEKHRVLDAAEEGRMAGERDGEIRAEETHLAHEHEEARAAQEQAARQEKLADEMYHADERKAVEHQTRRMAEEAEAIMKDRTDEVVDVAAHVHDYSHEAKENILYPVVGIVHSADIEAQRYNRGVQSDALTIARAEHGETVALESLVPDVTSDQVYKINRDDARDAFEVPADIQRQKARQVFADRDSSNDEAVQKVYENDKQSASAVKINEESVRRVAQLDDTRVKGALDNAHEAKHEYEAAHVTRNILQNAAVAGKIAGQKEGLENVVRGNHALERAAIADQNMQSREQARQVEAQNGIARDVAVAHATARHNAANEAIVAHSSSRTQAWDDRMARHAAEDEEALAKRAQRDEQRANQRADEYREGAVDIVDKAERRAVGKVPLPAV